MSAMGRVDNRPSIDKRPRPDLRRDAWDAWDASSGRVRSARITELLASLALELVSEPATPTPHPEASPPKVLLTVAEAAARLGVGKTTAAALVRAGDLESVRIGRLRRVHVDAITRYAAGLCGTDPAA